MTNLNKISIIIPTSNHCGDFLAPCLESIIRYTNLEEIEIIVISHGSTDDTDKYVKSLGPPFKLISFSKILNKFTAINLGLEVANGEFIVLLSDDTVLLRQNKNVWIDMLSKPFKFWDVGITGPCKINEYMQLFCVMIRKSLFDKLGLLNSALTDDEVGKDFCSKVISINHHIVQIPEERDEIKNGEIIHSFPIWNDGIPKSSGSEDKKYNKFHGESVSNSLPTDQILRQYFPDYDYKGTIIEVGGYHPIILSNSYHFEKNNWKAYCIEANSLNFSNFSIRENALNYACGDRDEDDVSFDVVTTTGWTAGFSSLNVNYEIVDKFGGANTIEKLEKIKVKLRKLDTLLLNEMKKVESIDILTIDVEGSELDVLKGFDINKWKPKVVFLEDIFHNDGISEVHKYITSFGYKLDQRYEYNCFYILDNTNGK